MDQRITMRILVIVVLGLFLTVLQVDGNQRKKIPSQQKTKENTAGANRPRDAKAMDCVSQIQPNEEEEASFFRKEIPDTDKGKCLLACYLEAKQVISGGKFNSAGAMKMAARVYPNSVTKTGHVKHILSHCGTVASRETEKCQLAYRLADCTTSLSDKFKL